MKSNIKKILFGPIKYLKKSIKETFLGKAYEDASPEEWHQIFNRNFEKGKKISDFIAIIMRAAFAYLCFLFFWNFLQQAENDLQRYAIFNCAILSLIMYFVIFFYIIRITVIYFLKDSANHNNKFYISFIIFTAVVIGFSTAYGVSILVTKVATVSNILN